MVMPMYKANEAAISITEETVSLSRANLPFMENKMNWVNLPKRKHKFNA
jgi:hypothetical protein